MAENEKLDYSQMQEITLDGKTYIFNPYSLGVGLWAEKTSRGKPGVYANKDTQRKLNKKAFGYEDLPNISDRLSTANPEKRRRINQTSVEWLQAKFALIKAGYQSIPDSRSRSGAGIKGMMFFYEYDPKWKDVLPMWDRFPLVIVLETYGDGFLGLNLHYASESDRTALLMSVLNTRIYSRDLNSMKINLDYDRLVLNAKKFPNFKNCIKRYLTQHIVGRALEIKPHEWGLATFLPAADFQYNKNPKKRK